MNESTGNILDDDKVIDTLETLKREAAEITKKLEETEVVVAEVEQITAQYMSLAQARSSTFFIPEQLSTVNHFYQFSLRFFLDTFDHALHHNPHLQRIMDYQEHLDIPVNDLFLTIFKWTSRTLPHRDHILLKLAALMVKQ